MMYLLMNSNYNERKKFKQFSFKRYFRYFKIYFKFNVILLIIIVSLISNTIVKNQNKKYDSLYENIENTVITGVVISNPKENNNTNTFKLQVKLLNNNNKYSNTNLIIQTKNLNNVKYGDKVEINGKFIQPSTQRNYKGFNYKNYLKTQKIFGTVKANKITVISHNCFNQLKMFLNQLYLKIKNNIETVLKIDKAQLVLGIILGETDDLDENIKQQFSDSSMSYILAVSGMHVTYISMQFLAISKPLLGNRKSKIILIFVLIFYMFITGSTPSIIRATIMNVLINLSSIIYRKNDTWNSMCISLLIILIYNPLLLIDVSTLISYVGTIGIFTLNNTILYLLKKIKIKNKKYKYAIKRKFAKIIKYIRETLAITISVQIVIMPIIILYFNTISFSFLITNILLGLVIGPIISLSFLLIVLSFISINFGKILSFVLNPILDVLLFISNFGTHLPFSKMYIVTPYSIEVFSYYLLVYIQNFLFKIYIPQKPSSFQFRIRNIISLVKYKIRTNKNNINKILVLSFIIIIGLHIIPNNLKIHFIDVGQGDSTLIITPHNHSILIDGGGSINTNFDVGKSTLLPYLLDRRITKVDYIFFSHFDEDHALGCVRIMEELKVSNIVLTRQLKENDVYINVISIAQEKNIKLLFVEAGNYINIDGIRFDFLHPQNKLMNINEMNNNSMVLKIKYKSFSMLFTGDIEFEAEKLILNENIDLKADILKVAHHGSKTSTTEDFLAEISPKIALIGVGKNNNFGHPSEEIIHRLQNDNVKIYRTDENGEISITANTRGKIIKIRTKI